MTVLHAGSRPKRLILLVAVCLLVLGGAAFYVVSARARQNEERSRSNAPAQIALAKVLAEPHVVFRNTNLRTGYGMLAVVSLAHPSGPRAITSIECDRVYSAATRSVCLSSSTGVVTTYSAHLLNSTMHPVASLPLTGIPSRTRLSHDARYAATTSFVAGDSYAGTSFSTRTLITRIGGGYSGALEDFTLMHDGHSIKPVDRNFWGVTFASDDDTFYATVAWGGHTWLVKGSMSRRIVTTVHEDAECPSLSPDGRLVAFKQRGDLPPGHWRLAVLDLSNGRVTELAETRSVDDQAEWLNNSTVLYGLPRTGSQAAVDDVWAVPANGTGKPSLFIPQAWSPAVVR
jgi:hypothetical protein